MKVAFYLGSFNPFHNGHLEVIDQAFNFFDMDIVVIVPAMQNPFKKEPPLEINKRIGIIHSFFYFDKHYYTIRDDYYKILKKKSSKIIVIDKIEESLIPPYYSYATLHALKNKYYNNEIFILCGEDTINDIPNWMHGGKIIEDYNFLICDRPDYAVSSTEIREKVKKGIEIGDLVNKNVINLIKKYYE